jgi:tape measure domain-containing protein
MKIYEYVIRLKDQASDKLKRLAGGTTSVDRNMNRLDGSFNKVTASGNMFGGMASMVARYVGPAVLGAALLTTTAKASNLAREFEQTRISFEVMMGSVAQGRDLLGQIETMANVTPFTGRDLQSASKTLLGFGVDAKKILPTLKMLGDVSGGNSERLRLLSLAYAQTQAAGRLMGQDLLQMVNSGFNPLQIISEKTGMSMGKLKEKMEQGAISAQMVESAFRDATSEGGRFFGMMDKQSQTFEGRLSTMQDKWDILLRSMGQNLNDTLSPYLDIVIQKLDRLNNPVAAIGNEDSAELKAIRKLNTEIKPLLEKYEQLLKIKERTAEQNKEILRIDELIKKDFRQGLDVRDNRVVGVDINKGLQSISKENEAYVSSNLDRVIELQDQLKRVQTLIDNKGFGVNDKDWMGRLKDGVDPVKQLLDAEKKKVTILDQINQLNSNRKEIRFLAFDKETATKSDYSGLTNGKGADDTKNGIDTITKGGKQAVNVHIEFGNLLQNTGDVMVTNVKESIADMERLLVEGLLRVVNSGNQAANQ